MLGVPNPYPAYTPDVEAVYVPHTQFRGMHTQAVVHVGPATGAGTTPGDPIIIDWWMGRIY